MKVVMTKSNGRMGGLFSVRLAHKMTDGLQAGAGETVDCTVPAFKPAASAADILKELQLSGVFDHMRAQALQQVVEKVRSAADLAPAEEPAATPEPAATAPEHDESGAKGQSGSACFPDPVPAFAGLQKRVREVAAAALASAPPGESKGVALKRMREAVEAEGLYSALSDLVDSVLEHDDAFQTSLVAAVQEATAEAVHPHKRSKIVTNTADNGTEQYLEHPPPPPSSS